MAAENIKELLGSLSVAKLRAMDEALDRQIAERKTEKSWIADALAKKGAAPKSSRTDSPARKPQKVRAGGQNTGSAAAIRQIISAEPDRVWMPAEVIDAVLMQGVRSTPSSIRVALRRMGDKGFLERGPDGTGWTLAKSNGAPQGSFDEQPSQTSHPKALPAGGGENVG
jgi:hypothetical protein